MCVYLRCGGAGDDDDAGGGGPASVVVASGSSLLNQGSSLSLAAVPMAGLPPVVAAAVSMLSPAPVAESKLVCSCGIGSSPSAAAPLNHGSSSACSACFDALFRFSLPLIPNFKSLKSLVASSRSSS